MPCHKTLSKDYKAVMKLAVAYAIKLAIWLKKTKKTNSGYV